LVWHHPNGIVFVADDVDIAVPLCGASCPRTGAAGDAVSTLPSTH
jgi:hypothetical protein